MRDLWTYDETTRAVTDENGLTIARDVGIADGHAIVAAKAGDAGDAYDRGFDDGFADGGNAERGGVQKVIDAAKALLATFGGDTPDWLMTEAAALETTVDEWEAN